MKADSEATVDTGMPSTSRKTKIRIANLGPFGGNGKNGSKVFALSRFSPKTYKNRDRGLNLF